MEVYKNIDMFPEHCTPRNISTFRSSTGRGRHRSHRPRSNRTGEEKVEVTTAGKRKARMSVCAAQNRLYLCVPAEITSAFQPNDCLEQPESSAVLYAP